MGVRFALPNAIHRRWPKGSRRYFCKTVLVFPSAPLRSLRLCGERVNTNLVL